jgi:hypothetical protein
LALLPLLLDGRALLLRRWGLSRGLLLRHGWAGAFLLPPRRFLRRPLLLDILLPAVSRRFLPFALRSHGRSAHVLLIMLPHYGVARLVAVPLALERLLLVYCAGVPIS